MNDTAIDVLVIGAGLTGAMIAARLAEHGMRVGVVDAQAIGQGATRRALGLATLHPHSVDLAETARGVAMLKQAAEHEGVLVQSCTTLHLASAPERQQALQDIAHVKPDAHLEWTTQEDLLPPGFIGGLLVHDSALVDVEMLMIRLLQHPNITVRQHAEVLKLDTQHGLTYALCKDYTIPARCVVLATNVYVGRLSPYLADSVRGVRGAMWSSWPLRDRAGLTRNMRLNTPLFVDDARLTFAPGKGARLQAAAWQWNDREGNGDPSDELHRFLKHMDAALLTETDEWVTGVTTTTEDGAPLVGRLDTDGAVLYAIGLGAYGLAWAPIVAEKIAALAQAQ